MGRSAQQQPDEPNPDRQPGEDESGVVEPDQNVNPDEDDPNFPVIR